MSIVKFVITFTIILAILLSLIAGAGILFLYLSNQKVESDEKKSLNGISKSIILSSTAFENDGFIPETYTKISPPLQWKNIPVNTKSIVIIMTDFDAPSPKLRLFSPAHWVVFNISPETDSLEQGVNPNTISPAKFGKNVSDLKSYAGPKPPFGVHRYTIRIYATSLDYINPANPTKDQVLRLIQGKIIAYGELNGKYGKE